MLEIILERHVIYVVMGILTVAGILSKLIVTVTLKRMVKAAGNMSKSNHPLMRLVRAKFEHACMVSDKVENVGVFVDKYLYEYKKFGVRLHSFRRMENVSAFLCLVLGIIGAALEYGQNGMNDAVLQMGATGAGLGILIYLVHLTTDENYRVEAAKNYMVDYLENVCLRRYEKISQKELKLMDPDDGQAAKPLKMSNEAVQSGYPKDDEDRNLEEAFDEDEELGDEDEPVAAAAFASGRTDRTERLYEANRADSMENIDGIENAEELRAAAGSETTPISSRSKRQSRKAKKEMKSSERMQRELAMAGQKKEEEASDGEVGKDILIRQILEEFMA